MTGIGASAVQLDVVVISLSGSGATVTCQLQESNDLENWLDKGSTTAPTTVGYTLAAAQTGLASGYVRLKITLSGTTPICVVSAGVNADFGKGAAIMKHAMRPGLAVGLNATSGAEMRPDALRDGATRSEDGGEGPGFGGHQDAVSWQGNQKAYESNPFLALLAAKAAD